MGVLIPFCETTHKTTMKAVLAALLVLAAACHAAPDKRFIISDIKDAFEHIGDGISHAFNSAKHEFSKIVSHIPFNQVVDNLVPLINSGMSQAACKKACELGAGKVFENHLHSMGSTVNHACGPVCKGALSKIQDVAGR